MAFNDDYQDPKYDSEATSDLSKQMKDIKNTYDSVMKSNEQLSASDSLRELDVRVEKLFGFLNRAELDHAK